MEKLFNIIDIFPHTNGTNGVGMIIKINQSYYLVDKADTFDAGWETMVFCCDEEGEVTDWQELYADRTNKSVWKCAQEFAESYFKDQLDTHINS